MIKSTDYSVCCSEPSSVCFLLRLWCQTTVLRDMKCQADKGVTKTFWLPWWRYGDYLWFLWRNQSRKKNNLLGTSFQSQLSLAWCCLFATYSSSPAHIHPYGLYKWGEQWGQNRQSPFPCSLKHYLYSQDQNALTFFISWSVTAKRRRL